MTFDYEHRALYLQKSPDFGHEMPYNRSGIQLDLNDARAIVVKAVNSGSPADLAEVKPGDQLLAVNHNDVHGKDLSDVEDQFTQAAGTHLDVEILRDGVRKTTGITLKELLPPDGAFQSASIP
jgi:C-terminal processing protease CtpA/Prc